MLDTGLFITIAEIAGIFVGFGALIGITRRAEIEMPKLLRIRGLVTIGLGVIVASLIPIGLDRYGISGHTLWLVSSIIFLVINWAVSLLSLRKSEVRKLLADEMRDNPYSGLFFWILLEVPFQVPLILIILGVFREMEPALYTTSIFFSLFEAAFVLTQLVHSNFKNSRK